MKGRIFVVRVGADTTLPPVLQSPIFPQQTFEFVPILEGESYEHRPIPYAPPMLRYKDIISYNDSVRTIADILALPDRWAAAPAHNDPEFDTYTYGDVWNPRAANLIKEAHRGDYLFFLARLVQHDGYQFTGNAGFYFVGFFKVENVYQSGSDLERAGLETNAHVRELMAGRSSRDFWVFRGKPPPASIRFNKALPVTLDWCLKVFRDKDGDTWQKKRGQSELQRIMSYTKTIRCQLDPAKPTQQKRYELFWDTVNLHLKS